VSDAVTVCGRSFNVHTFDHDAKKWHLQRCRLV
jgi:hypothetical protein